MDSASLVPPSSFPEQQQSFLRLPAYRSSYYRRFHPYARFTPPLRDILRDTPGPRCDDDNASSRAVCPPSPAFQSPCLANGDDTGAAHLQDAVSPQSDSGTNDARRLQPLVIDLEFFVTYKLKSIRISRNELVK